jgi:hypothetical protein
LEQQIKLPAHRPAVELLATYRKLDISSPESIYFAFPLALREWRAHFDPANQPVELDAGQLPGTCRDYLTTGEWISVHNAQCCVTLACPDIPLFQIGGFNFGRELKSVPRESPALLLSWAMNNYYNVNFRGPSQPGPARFRFELTTERRFDAAASTHAGAEAAHRLEVHPVVKLKRGREGNLVEVTGAGITLQGMRAAADGAGIIAVLSNITDQPAEASIRLPRRPIRQAWRCSTLEENRDPLTVVEGTAHFTIAPRAVVTIRLAVK